MAQTNTNKNEDSKANESPANGHASKIPDWMNEENFKSVLEQNIEGFKKILNFEVGETGGGGENYASIMMRVKAKVELEAGQAKDVAFMIKTIPQGEQGAAMVTMMGLFPKESAMYGKYLREFEQMYHTAGKEVTFGPKFYKLKNDPGVEYVLLEDISPKGFKNLNRLEGLDKEHTKSVLKLLAELHAVSAVRYEQKGDYEESFLVSPFKQENRDNLEAMMKPILKVIKESFSKYETSAKYLHKLQPLLDNMTDKYIEIGKLNRNDFNVIIHGDLWANNIMFRHNDEGQREQTVFVDFQMSRYASPVVDLFYFLLSSTRLDIKLECFDEFVKFYHDNLIENLVLLNYPQKMPTLKQLRMDLLRYSSWAVSTMTGILAAVLLDPTENANIENFFEECEQAMDFKMQLYDNPRFIKHIEAILPWMDKMGYLDD